MTAVKTVNITQNQREKMRTSMGQRGGRRPALHLFLPSQEIIGTHSFLPQGPNQQRPGVLTKGRGTPSAGSGEVVSPWRLWKCFPRYRVWEWYGSHPIHMGQDPVPGDHIFALYLQCVLFPWRFPVSELRVLPWLTHGLFLLFVLSHSCEVRHLWMGCCSLLSVNFGGIILISWHISYLIHRGHHCLVPPTPSSGNLFCNLIFILYWGRVDFPCFVGFRCTGTWFDFTQMQGKNKLAKMMISGSLAPWRLAFAARFVNNDYVTAEIT